VQQLEDGVKYDVAAFDPTSGEMAPIGGVSKDDAARVLAKPDSIKSDDWVIVLEREK
jgi:hypothetical protein